MKIACLGWGSLIWDPRDLPVDSEWFYSGPALPIEFTRQSRGGRITLVITGEAEPLKVFWATLRATSLDDARGLLRTREGNPPLEHIGSWQRGELPHAEIARTIANWAEAVGLDGVVWTALPPKFGGRDITPSADQVITHLSGLIGEERADAQAYIRRAPPVIVTAYRRVIEDKLGWTPIAEC